MKIGIRVKLKIAILAPSIYISLFNSLRLIAPLPSVPKSELPKNSLFVFFINTLEDASEKIGLHEVLFLLINLVYVSLKTISPCL